jgi:flagellar basal body-associated protein FliL
MAKRRDADIPDDDPKRAAGIERAKGVAPRTEEAEERRSRESFRDRLRRSFLQAGRIASTGAGWVRSHRVWVYGGCGALFLLIVAVSAGLYFKGSRPDTAREKGAETPAVALQSVFSFDNFTIDLKDPQGNYKLLICDVVLELNRPDLMTEERKVVIRKTIYETARKKSSDLLSSTQAHRVFKRQIGTELGSLMGPETIREVYVTKFVLL